MLPLDSLWLNVSTLRFSNMITIPVLLGLDWRLLPSASKRETNLSSSHSSFIHKDEAADYLQGVLKAVVLRLEAETRACTTFGDLTTQIAGREL